jgi:hypothetical protein
MAVAGIAYGNALSVLVRLPPGAGLAGEMAVLVTRQSSGRLRSWVRLFRLKLR